MPRTKATPVRNEDAVVSETAPLVILRLRTPKGIVNLNELTARSTLQELRNKCEVIATHDAHICRNRASSTKENVYLCSHFFLLKSWVNLLQAALGAPLASLSFRGDSGMGTVSLLSGGQWPALGALLIGPESSLTDLGLENGTMLMASPAAVPSPKTNKRAATKPSGPKAAKKQAASQATADSGTTTSSSSSSSSDAAAAVKVESKTRLADALALRFVHAAGDSGDGALAGPGLATHFQSAASADKRLTAAAKGFVTISDVGGASGKHLDVSFRTTTSGATSDERVQRLSPEDCSDVCAHILFRITGSRRRRAATLAENGGSGPSTKLLNPDDIAVRLPDLFWSLYDNSRFRTTVSSLNACLDYCRCLKWCPHHLLSTKFICRTFEACEHCAFFASFGCYWLNFTCYLEI